MNLSTDHYIYTGTVRHRRHDPFDSEFSYPVFMVYLDINDLDSVMKKSIFWNVDKSAIVSFQRNDFHGDVERPLDIAVRDTVKKRTGVRPEGKIRMLAHLRYFGYCFNPVSFYYCFDSSDSFVEAILAEVTNTPWKERHAYVIDLKANKSKNANLIGKLEKELHVSPFWGMDHQYEWFFTEPNENLLVNMKNFKDQSKVFDATLKLERKTFSKSNLIRYILQFPFITLIVVFRIHWQALILWIKRAPFFIHPKKVNYNKV